MKDKEFTFKVLTQVMIYMVEMIGVAGVLTFLSFKAFDIQTRNELLSIAERFILFYGIYQLMVAVVVHTINDVAADSWLALKSTIELAILAVIAQWGVHWVSQP